MSVEPVTTKTVTIPRWVAILFAVGVTLDVLIGVSLGYVAVQARNAAATARINRVAAYQSCLANERSKQADLGRWDAIIALLRTGPDSPQLQVFIAGVQKANRTADAPRNCALLVP